MNDWMVPFCAFIMVGIISQKSHSSDSWLSYFTGRWRNWNVRRIKRNREERKQNSISKKEKFKSFYVYLTYYIGHATNNNKYLNYTVLILRGSIFRYYMCDIHFEGAHSKRYGFYCLTNHTHTKNMVSCKRMNQIETEIEFYSFCLGGKKQTKCHSHRPYNALLRKQVNEFNLNWIVILLIHLSLTHSFISFFSIILYPTNL